MQEHILIVDDDRQETDFLERFFTKNGYRSTGVYTAAEMFKVLESERADLVVLDLILPDQDGFEAAKRLQNEADVPIIMLSARNETYDRVVGLEIGADDYVTKPYEPRELLARVRSVLRRCRKIKVERRASGLRVLGNLELDFDAQTARRRSDNLDLGLSHMEFSFVKALVAREGRVVSRADLVELLYGAEADVSDRAIDAHVARLRRKLSVASGGGALVATVHGEGYRFVTPAAGRETG
ncbi:MAG: response regulator transcription factor [Pseudomonadota bacterium]